MKTYDTIVFAVVGKNDLVLKLNEIGLRGFRVVSVAEGPTNLFSVVAQREFDDPSKRKRDIVFYLIAALLFGLWFLK